MAAVSTQEAALQPLVNGCSEIGVLAAAVACSVADLLDNRPEEPALVDLVKRLREFTGTLEQLKHQLNTPRLIPIRLAESIKTSFENFHESLVHLEQQVVKTQLAVTGTDKQRPLDLAQVWPERDIRTEGRILGFQFQNATLLISSIQENDIEDRSSEPSLVAIQVHSRNASNASSSTTVANLTRDSTARLVSTPDLQPRPSSSAEGISSTEVSGAPQSPDLRQTSSTVFLDAQVAGPASAPPVVLDAKVAGPVSARPGPPNQGVQPPLRVLTVSQRKIARSFTWKLSAGGRQLVQQLCQACEENDHEWVKVLLSKGAYVNGHQTTGQVDLKTPLILALERDAEQIVATLLKNGADPNARGTGKRIPVCIEMERLILSGGRSLKFLDLLLDHGANIEQRIDGWSLLAVAVHHSRLDLVNFLLSKGANARPYYIFRQNMMRKSEVALDIAASLLRAGATPNPDEAHDFYPLQYAITNLKSLPWVKLLVSHGAVPSILCKGKVPLNRRNEGFMLNPSLVHLAAYRGRSSILAFLLSQNVNPSTACKFNNGAGEVWNQVVPLHLAQTRNDVGILVQHGANISAQDSQGRTPLFWACANFDCDLIKAHLELGSRPNTRSFTGATAFHQLIVKLYKLDTVKANKALMEKVYQSANVLLDAGARVDLRGGKELSVYHIVTKEPPKFLGDPSTAELNDERRAMRQIFHGIRAMILVSVKGNTSSDQPASTTAPATPTPAASPALPSNETGERETSPSTAVVPKDPISSANNPDEVTNSPRFDRAIAPSVTLAKHTIGGGTVEGRRSKTIVAAVVAGMHEDYTLY